MPMPTMRRPEDTPGTEEFRRALAADQARTARQRLPLSEWTYEDLARAHRGAKSRQDRIYASSAHLPALKKQVNAEVSALWAELCRRAAVSLVALALAIAGPALAEDPPAWGEKDSAAVCTRQGEAGRLPGRLRRPEVPAGSGRLPMHLRPPGHRFAAAGAVAGRGRAMKGVLSVWLATGESYESLFPTVEEAEAALDALDLGPGDEAEAGPIPPGEVSRG